MQPVVGKIAEIKGSQVDPRFEPCDLLLQARIPCKIWGEDVLSFYGVPTVVFDLFILVSNPNEASQSLINQGYSLSTPNPRFAHIPELSHRVSRLVPSVLADKTTRTSSLSSSDGLGLVEADDTVLTGVVLLSASDWNYPLPDSVTGLQELVPSLHEYFDCIVEKWMDLPKDSDDLRDHLAIHIGYHSLYLDEVWTEDFEKQVRKEHRQFLFDLLADGAAGRVDLLHSECQVYHRDIKGRILEGNHEPVIHDKFVRERVGPVNVGSRFELTVP
ncbi:uncharacterized protein N7498_000828 [Penicillium cinerascens]|uniref:Uncharacterized protein n=1 Tax=Penicillium cinerascens TaxID=70096 RepID=A0A9W9NF27_9EURO|nr:uncharacterized protein N7498_000828 [Penicillium cinerascens]KAJ5218729.1 hypothetical protein N7498_000828 [Penicillium cinerascens]